MNNCEWPTTTAFDLENVPLQLYEHGGGERVQSEVRSIVVVFGSFEKRVVGPQIRESFHRETAERSNCYPPHSFLATSQWVPKLCALCMCLLK